MIMFLNELLMKWWSFKPIQMLLNFSPGIFFMKEDWKAFKQVFAFKIK